MSILFFIVSFLFLFLNIEAKVKTAVEFLDDEDDDKSIYQDALATQRTLETASPQSLQPSLFASHLFPLLQRLFVIWSHCLGDASFWKTICNLWQNEKGSQESPMTGQMAIFITYILYYFPMHKTALLTTLAFGLSFSLPRFLWFSFLTGQDGYLSHFPVMHDQFLYTGIYPSFWMNATAAFWPVLNVLVSTLSQQLFITGDDDLIEGHFALTLNEVASMSKQLEWVAYALHAECLTEQSTLKSPSSVLTPIVMRQLLTRFLCHVHDRDARRAFCPPDFWLLPHPLDASNLEDAYLQRLEEARETMDIDEERNIATSNPPGFNQFSSLAARASRKQRQETLLLALLRSLPFCIPFQMRVRIFRRLVQRDRLR